MTRHISFRILCGLFGLLFTFLTIGTLGEAISDGGPDGHVHVLLLAHAATLGACMAAGFLLQLYRPERRVAAWQMMAVTTVVVELIIVVVGVNDPVFGIGFPLTVGLVGLLHPARRDLVRIGGTLSPVLAPIALLAFVPAAIGSVRLVDHAGDVTGDLELAFQAGVLSAMMIPVLGLLAALHTTGWRVPLRVAGLLSVVMGLASIGYPSEDGSLGAGWGAAAALVGIAFIAFGEWEARREIRVDVGRATVR